VVWDNEHYRTIRTTREWDCEYKREHTTPECLAKAEQRPGNLSGHDELHELRASRQKVELSEIPSGGDEAAVEPPLQ
jgi:hypothetical protein